MLSPVQWNLWSALKIVLNFSCYAKFSFPHCSKVTRASQEKKKADCIQGEWRSSILTWLPVYLFFFQDFFFFFLNYSSSPSWPPTFCISLYLDWDQGHLSLSCISFLPLFPQTIHLLSTCPDKRKRWLPHSSMLANAKSSRDALEISSSQTLHHQLSCYPSLISPSLHTQLCLQMLPCSKNS